MRAQFETEEIQHTSAMTASTQLHHWQRRFQAETRLKKTRADGNFFRNGFEAVYLCAGAVYESERH